MAFEGYREESKGRWFGGGAQMVYVSNELNENKFFIVNEVECHLIRIREEKQIELLFNCMYGPQLSDEEIEWLISQAGFKYYDSVGDYIAREQ
ncbi:hypothetical protein [Lysinibacillus piscis]|uniref:Uncharacterized protein n=1 Tax=Lysinibacillus piscis TaxID=2518931 RepID=A0ABQ5NKN6_9BACI|nr:hypothetical protein [Lysinibacillus sp. KH24]GLC88683.1 hypothetical protein LYSBPC_18100 [Lysinibacillus sp. KH24]